jgi:lysophospholipase L1-like esterase
VVAATGYTTREVTQLVNTAIFDKPFDIISIQVGVNNQYRGESVAQFGEELEDLFETIASNYYLKDAKQFIVSIPDWGATPFGSSYDRVQIAIEINQFNGLKRNASEARSVPFINITDISRTNPDAPELVASDGLHPSELMYSYWIERIFPVVKQQLQP